METQSERQSGSRRPRLRLRTLFLLVNLIILLLPLGGIAVLRLYETAMVQRTEAKLIAQGALVSAMFREELVSRFEAEPPESRPDPAVYGNPLDPRWRVEKTDEPYMPILPRHCWT